MYIGPFYFGTEEIFEKYPEIKLVYLFGSRAEGKASPLSDYDFAVYFDEKTTKRRQFAIKLELVVKIAEKLKNDNIDIVVLNNDLEPLLKYHIVKYGQIIFEKGFDRLILEPKIYSEFFDYQIFTNQNRL